MDFIINKYLSNEEREELKKYGDYGNINPDTVYNAIYNAKSPKTLTELSDGNKEVAKLLISASERAQFQNKDEELKHFLFNNNNPLEDKLQRSLLPEQVKKIRSLAGLSQKKFAEIHDISIRSLEEWEAGRKKITKYAYNYLESCLSGKTEVEESKILGLPLNILCEDTIKYLKEYANSDRYAREDIELTELINAPIVRHIEWCPWQEESYLVLVDSTEEITEDGKLKYARDNYPKDLAECVRVASLYKCKKIEFTKEPITEGRIVQQLRETISKL